jgi:hypothetical protein
MPLQDHFGDMALTTVGGDCRAAGADARTVTESPKLTPYYHIKPLLLVITQ